MKLRLLATIAAVALLALAWPAPPSPRALAPPVIVLDLEPPKPEVGQEVTVSWQVTGAVSVTVRRDGQQVSTDAAGAIAFTVADKRPITWAVAASNRAGAASKEVTVRPVTFGSAASFITSGMEAAGGLWVGQRVKPFHRPSSQTPAPGPGENRRPGPPCRNQGGLSSPGDSYHYPPSENHHISSLRTPGLPPRGRFGPI